MSMIKKGSCPPSKISVSSTVYICNSCGYTQMIKGSSKKKCPKCHSDMTMISSSCDAESSNQETSNTV